MMEMAARSARRFLLGSTMVMAENAIPVVTFHRAFLLNLNILSDAEMGNYLDRFTGLFDPKQGPEERYFWTYRMDGPNGIDVFRYNHSMHGLPFG